MPVIDLDQPLQAPQWSEKAERSVLGTLLVNDEQQPLLLSMLSVNDFQQGEHQLIYKAVKAVFQSGDAPDMLNVELELERQGVLDQAGSATYLAELSGMSRTDAVPQAKRVLELSRLRQFQSRMKSRLSEAGEAGVNVEELLMGAERDLFELLTGSATKQAEPFTDVLRPTLEHLSSIQGSVDGVTGIASGLPYDEITAGWQASEFYVIAGRPGMGKTAFMLQNLKTAAKAGEPVGVMSMEMSSQSLVSRMLIAEAGLDSWKARTGKLTDPEIEKMHKAAQKLQGLGMILDDQTDMNPSKMRLTARMMYQRYRIKLLAVDYLQLMKADNDSREQQVAEISRTCKLVAKELNIPVLGLSQLSRKPDDRRGWDRRPQLSDLRESGAIEQDADCVIFLFRPEEYKGLEHYPDSSGGESTEGVAEVIVAKNRHGPTGKKKLHFDKKRMEFERIVHDPVPHPAQSWYDNEQESMF